MPRSAIAWGFLPAAATHLWQSMVHQARSLAPFDARIVGNTRVGL